jgi:GAF domain-containing protein
MAEWFDYRGCWSFPICADAESEALGTFAIYSRLPRHASELDIEYARLVTEAAAAVIMRHLTASAGLATRNAAIPSDVV